MDKCLVTVIMPVYNAEKYLPRSLAGVVNQTYGNLEIILIDDGSMDRSYEICERFARKDPRIILLRQENAGVSAARNRGLSQAEGDYITFVDADDFLPEKAVELLVGAAQCGGDLIVGSHEEIRWGRSRAVIREPAVYAAASGRIDISQCDGLIRLPWAHLYRRRIIQEKHIRFDTRLPLGEDTVFNLNYCQHAKKVTAIPDIVYRYRLGGMASHNRYYPNRNEIALGILEAYSAYYGGREKIPLPFLKEKVKEAVINSILHYMGCCDYKTARSKIRETYARLEPYLSSRTIDEENYSPAMVQCILRGDAQKTMAEMGKTYWFRMFVKKLKKVWSWL